MKKICILTCALMAAAAASAQSASDINEVLDQKEDTTNVTTIAKIVETQNFVTNNNSSSDHFNTVWGYSKYFKISYGGVSLDPKGQIPLGCDFNDGVAPKFKSDWSVGLTFGRNYCLHKKPIANMVKINLDYTFFDLGFTHFEAEGDKHTPVYDSSATWEEREDDGVEKRFYTPWCLQKFKADFGMAIGPSVTVAPFTHLSSARGLHFLKFNAYYHIGYHASLLWMSKDDKRDAGASAADKDRNNDNSINFGHGLTNTFGAMISWKTIGLGYEMRTTNVSYQSLYPGTFGHEKDKFKTNSSRIYLVIRY